MPAAPRGLPTIFLGETPKGERELPPVYLCETSHDGAGCRLKWMASTCLAGMVGVCLIGVAIYASMNMSDGSGMVSSIKRASLAALQPIRSARLAHDAQSPSGQKEDRIQMTSAGFVSRHVIHDTVVERQGSREFITIKPYLRIVAGMAMSPPENANDLPPFNPFKLYSDTTPIGGGDASADAAQSVVINVVDVPGGLLPQIRPCGARARPGEPSRRRGRRELRLCRGPADLGEGGGEATLQLASYRPDEVERPRLLPNTTVMQKTFEEDEDLSDENDRRRRDQGDRREDGRQPARRASSMPAPTRPWPAPSSTASTPCSAPTISGPVRRSTSASCPRPPTPARWSRSASASSTSPATTSSARPATATATISPPPRRRKARS